jgi:hypothetical protein
MHIFTKYFEAIYHTHRVPEHFHFFFFVYQFHTGNMIISISDETHLVWPHDTILINILMYLVKINPSFYKGNLYEI